MSKDNPSNDNVNVNVKNNGCRLYELQQFMCEELEDKNEGIKVKCYPLPRVFYECPNRPVVEITSLVTIDSKTGEIAVPDNLEEKLPKGKLWQDIKREQS